MSLERSYQPRVIARLRRQFPGCFILKNDEQYIQGIPDLTVLYEDRWGVLETKRNRRAVYRPNQPHYLELLNGMSFAARIQPENEEEVFDALQETFHS